MAEIIEDVPVRRSVYEAARHAEALGGNPAFHFAEMVRDAYRRHGQDDRAAFWQEIYDFLFMRECGPKGARIVILPD
jgi:hypothetical protein